MYICRSLYFQLIYRGAVGHGWGACLVSEAIRYDNMSKAHASVHQCLVGIKKLVPEVFI